MDKDFVSFLGKAKSHINLITGKDADKLYKYIRQVLAGSITETIEVEGFNETTKGYNKDIGMFRIVSFVDNLDLNSKQISNAVNVFVNETRHDDREQGVIYFILINDNDELYKRLAYNIVHRQELVVKKQKGSLNISIVKPGKNSEEADTYTLKDIVWHKSVSLETHDARCIPVSALHFKEFLEAHISSLDLDVDCLNVFLYGDKIRPWLNVFFDDFAVSLSGIDAHGDKDFLSFSRNGQSKVISSDYLLLARADLKQINQYHLVEDTLLYLFSKKDYRVLFTNDAHLVNKLFYSKVEGGISFFNFEEDLISLTVKGAKKVHLNKDKYREE